MLNLHVYTIFILAHTETNFFTLQCNDQGCVSFHEQGGDIISQSNYFCPLHACGVVRKNICRKCTFTKIQHTSTYIYMYNIIHRAVRLTSHLKVAFVLLSSLLSEHLKRTSVEISGGGAVGARIYIIYIYFTQCMLIYNTYTVILHIQVQQSRSMCTTISKQPCHNYSLPATSTMHP